LRVVRVPLQEKLPVRRIASAADIPRSIATFFAFGDISNDRHGTYGATLFVSNQSRVPFNCDSLAISSSKSQICRQIDVSVLSKYIDQRVVELSNPSRSEISNLPEELQVFDIKHPSRKPIVQYRTHVSKMAQELRYFQRSRFHIGPCAFGPSRANRMSKRPNFPITEVRETVELLLHSRDEMAIADFKQLVIRLIFLRSKYLAYPDQLSVTWNSVLASRTSSEMQFHLAILQECLIDSKSDTGIAMRNFSKHAEPKLRNVVRVLSILGKQTSKSAIASVFDQFLDTVAELEGQDSSHQFTPKPLRDLMIQMTQPKSGTVYDPCCGTGGLLLEAGKGSGELKLMGQELQGSLWQLCHLRLAIHGLEANLGRISSDTLNNDIHTDKLADWIFANPPFNSSNWNKLPLTDSRFQWGTPPENNANFAWIQHALNHLKPGGTAVLALPNNSLSSNQGGEDQIRQNLIQSNSVDCVVSLPKYRVGATRIFGALWVLRKPIEATFKRTHTLFIDAQTSEDAAASLGESLFNRITATYRAWKTSGYCGADESFSRAVSREEIAANRFVLTPNRYVHTFHDVEMQQSAPNALKSCFEKLNAQLQAAARLDHEIRAQFQLISLES